MSKPSRSCRSFPETSEITYGENSWNFVWRTRPSVGITNSCTCPISNPIFRMFVSDATKSRTSPSEFNSLLSAIISSANVSMCASMSRTIFSAALVLPVRENC